MYYAVGRSSGAAARGRHSTHTLPVLVHIMYQYEYKVPVPTGTRYEYQVPVRYQVRGTRGGGPAAPPAGDFQGRSSCACVSSGAAVVNDRIGACGPGDTVWPLLRTSQQYQVCRQKQQTSIRSHGAPP